GTHPSRFGDLTVGLTEGWWAFADHDLRPSYALLSREQWLDLLAEMGFRQATVLEPAGHDSQAFTRQAVIVAQGAAAKRSIPTEGNWLILADNNVGPALAVQLAGAFVATPGESFGQLGDNHFQLDPAEPAHFE